MVVDKIGQNGNVVMEAANLVVDALVLDKMLVDPMTVDQMVVHNIYVSNKTVDYGMFIEKC